MRSLHVTATTARRGAETFAVELTAALRAAGEQTHLVALTSARTSDGHGLPVLGPTRRSPATLFALRQRARTADVVVAHGSATLEACAVALTGCPTPFTYRSIGDPSYWVSAGARQRVLGVLHRRAARHVALWQGAADELAGRYGIDPGRIDVIPNATDVTRWPVADSIARARARERLGVEGGRPCLAYVGAISREKNVEAVIRVAERLRDAVVLVAGDGPDRDRIESEARSKPDLAARVRFLGTVTSPWTVYAAAHLLILPSLSEGMPAVVIEAGLVGTPSVATTVGALPEMICEPVGGRLVRPGDEDGLFGAVESALAQEPVDPEGVARQYRGQYSLERTVPAWIRSLERSAA